MHLHLIKKMKQLHIIAYMYSSAITAKVLLLNRNRAMCPQINTKDYKMKHNKGSTSEVVVEVLYFENRNRSG